MSSIVDNATQQPQPSFGLHDTGISSSPPPRRSIVKRASKLSFAKREKGKERDREPSTDKEREKDLQGRPSGLTTTASGASSSFFNVSSNQTPVKEADENTTLNGEPTTPSSATKVLPPIPRDFGPSTQPMPTGEVAKEVFDTISNNTLSVRFEINIVKVRLFFLEVILV
jgi:hypothetical protein